MDAATITAIGTLVTMLSTKALETWGPFGFCLIGLGLTLGARIFSQSRQLTEKDEEIALLRKEREEIMTRRLEDFEKTLRLAQSGTATMAVRSETDQALTTVLSRLSERLEGLEESVAALKPRRPSR